MKHHPLHILVVEDEPKWSGIIIETLLQYLAIAAHDAPPTVFLGGDAEFQNKQDLYINADYKLTKQVDAATILAVNTMIRAKDLIAELPAIHMVTMDMDLQGNSNLGEKEGMLLLENIIKIHPEAVSVVVSGRAGELDIAKQSMAHYGAVDAIVKGDELEEIEHSLCATLLFAEAVRLKQNLDISGAYEHSKYSLQLIENMTKNTRPNFKRRFQDFIRELDTISHASEIDEVTGLLNATVITRHAKELLKSGLPWAFGILVVDGLKDFEDNYGSFERIQLVKAVSQQIQEETKSVGNLSDFHLGYLGDGKFIITALEARTVQNLYERITNWFSVLSESFYSHITENKPKNLLSLRFFLKKNTQMITAIDDLFALTNADENTTGTTLSW